MGAGSLTLACLLLTVDATGPDGAEHLNTSKFALPIVIGPDHRAEASELELYISRDGGQTWNLFSRAKPSQPQFDISGLGDGAYCFTIVVVDPQNRRSPADLKTAPIGMKVVIDTRRPDIKLTADRVGDEIVVSWDIREENLDPRTLKMEWSQPGSLPVLAPVVNELHGQTRIRPTDPRASVSLRMMAADLAGNTGTGTAEVSAMSIAPPGTTVGSFQAPPPPPPASPGSITSTQNYTPLLPPPTPPTPPQGYAASGTYNPSLPQVQIVNKRQVRLEFDVSKVGPTGLGSVEVWTTTDDGRTWTPPPPRPDPSSWSLPAPMNGVGSVHGSVLVSLDREAVVYGYVVVVKSKAGLGKEPPHPGDAPQIRIELDTTAPKAVLTKVSPQADSLLIEWTASDAHLGTSPITLEWSAQREGPWTLIGDGPMPNTGSYAWRVTSDVPPKVYLRLTARDLVGNTAVGVSDNSIVVDLSVPEVSGVGLQVGTR